MKATKVKLASVDIGECGTPGSGASEIKAVIYRLSSGKYEVSGSYSTGSNQGYYRQNYCYGPWRGRGMTVEEARKDFLETVPSEYQDFMARASKEAMFEADDFENE